MDRQAVIVRMPVDGMRASLREVKTRLTTEIGAAGVGHLDSVGISPDGLVFYLYGLDADLLSRVVVGVLAEFQITGSYLTKRYGGPGSLEVRKGIW